MSRRDILLVEYIFTMIHRVPPGRLVNHSTKRPYGTYNQSLLIELPIWCPYRTWSHRTCLV